MWHNGRHTIVKGHTVSTSKIEGNYAELLTALALASDLNMGQSMEHGLKTVWIAMQLADQMRLSVEDKVPIYYGGLLKDAG